MIRHLCFPSLLAAFLAATPLQAKEPTTPKLTLIGRVVAQDQGDWQVDYAFRLDEPTGMVFVPVEVYAKVDGQVSNSHVPNHETPRPSCPEVIGARASWGLDDVIQAPDDADRCQERLAVRLTSLPGFEPRPTAQARRDEPEPDPLMPVSVAPGGTLRVQLRLEHRHFMYGEYDPLLGTRLVELRLGGLTIRDTLSLDREQYHAQAREAWPEIDADRRDPGFYRSAPDSLYLEAHIPGNQYYRLEKKARYDTAMKLSFWYLVAPGCQGEVRVRYGQSREGPNTWKILSDGAYEQRLSRVGRWTRVEKAFRTEAEATHVALDFRIVDAEVGEAWIDDITLEPTAPVDRGP